jgi:phosphohistidine swiveling domain-containing protein
MIYKGKSVLQKKEKIRGKALVIKYNFNGDENVPKNTILVCQRTDMLDLPLLKKFAGIVVESGGILSHAAIISREFNMPCIIGFETDITSKIKNDDELVMDLETGDVHVNE